MKHTTFGKLAAAGGVSLDSPTWVGTAFLPAETVSQEGKGLWLRGEGREVGHQLGITHMSGDGLPACRDGEEGEQL